MLGKFQNLTFVESFCLQWARDSRVVISHWNYTTEPILAPWEMNVANLEPYPHHFHGSRVFHFEETVDIHVQPRITEIYSYDWDESDYWGGVNKYTAIQVVTHISDGNSTALDDLLADDFSKFFFFSRAFSISSECHGVFNRSMQITRVLCIDLTNSFFTLSNFFLNERRRAECQCLRV